MAAHVQAAKPPRQGFSRLCAFACLALLQACASGAKLGSVDDLAITGSIAAPSPAEGVVADADAASDELTIRNAVTSADLSRALPLAWANRDTGARGAVTVISEFAEKGTVCRQYAATLESYSGIGYYEGVACLGRDGAWANRKFAAA